MGNIDSKRKLMMFGGVLGVFGALLAWMGNPKNMAICIACFIRDTAGAMKLHQAAAVQYVSCLLYTSLWKEGIYAESGMGCTGPIVQMSQANLEKAAGILKKAGYID